ncbi:peptidase M16 [Nostocoides sp. F2B08]|uniref:M16 family metallopeptidase n=1 Tax=Nostocoides sp. F2B08 TaxID=2653936 RepID=UPI001263AE30|nr:pitrilysin family protein [Tetrasphaera sp. F2B08]KAB7746199.1 peptidase M16 [Tetrasphaera sp. F2B08]
MPLDYPIHDHTLANGLRVVVSPDHTVPVVTVNLWVGVGSRHEAPGRTGFAHLFEHLMFQGSRSVAGGEHFAALMAQGGRLNATTWFDRTNYFETVPIGALELALWLEADRHGHLLAAVTQENLDNQRDVVKEEKRQRYDNQPYGNALVDVYAATFPDGHPYHHPTIGSMADLDAAGLDDVHAFYRRHYAPDNTVLTLVGDVDVDSALDLVERYFGGLDHRARPDGKRSAQLPPVEGPVRVDRFDDVPNDRLHLAFRLPAEGSDDYLAASLALDCVAGLTSSAMVTRLVRREQVATSIGAHAMGFVDGSSLGLVVADIAAGHDADRVEEEIAAELTRFAESGPAPELVEAVRAQAERGWLSALASGEERADLISQYTLLHDDPQYINTALDRILAIDASQVHRAAREWLRPQHRVCVAYLSRDADAEGAAA